MNKIVAKYPVLGSSVDPTQLSLTIKGALGLVALIFVGLGVSQVELNILIDNIVSLFLVISEAISLGAIIYGGIRKIINEFK
jgi:hypothetical protein